MIINRKQNYAELWQVDDAFQRSGEALQPKTSIGKGILDNGISLDQKEIMR